MVSVKGKHKLKLKRRNKKLKRNWMGNDNKKCKLKMSSLNLWAVPVRKPHKINSRLSANKFQSVAVMKVRQ